MGVSVFSAMLVQFSLKNGPEVTGSLQGNKDRGIFVFKQLTELRKALLRWLQNNNSKDMISMSEDENIKMLKKHRVLRDTNWKVMKVKRNQYSSKSNNLKKYNQ